MLQERFVGHPFGCERGGAAAIGWGAAAGSLGRRWRDGHGRWRRASADVTASGGGTTCGVGWRLGFLGMAATLLPPFVRGDSPDGPGRPCRRPCYSHSIVAGGLLLMS